MELDDFKDDDLTPDVADEVSDESPGGESNDDEGGAGEPATEVVERRTETPEDEDDYSTRVKKRIDKEVGKRKTAEEKYAESERLNAELRQRLETLTADVEQVKKRNATADAQAAEGTLQSKLASARQRLLQAKENQDFEAEITAQEELDDIRAQARELKTRPEQRETRDTSPAPVLPEGTRQWLAMNPWYTRAHDNPQHARLARAAAEIDAALQEDGYKPDDPETYNELNRRLRAALPKAASVLSDIGNPASRSPERARDGGPPSGASSPDATSRPAGIRRQFTSSDLADMRAFNLKDTPENRKIWLANHPN